jgi:hypothetical protein
MGDGGVVSGQEPESMRSSQTDAAEVLRLGQRRFAIRVGVIWLNVFIVTAALIGIGIVVREYIHLGTPSLQSLKLLGLILGSLVGMEALLLGALALATIRSQRLRQHRPAGDHFWTAVMYRLKHWSATLSSPVLVAILAVTAVLVIASVVARLHVDWPADPWEPTSSALELWLLTAAAALLAGATARAAFRRWAPRYARAPREPDQPPEDIRAEPHTGPVEVTVEPYRDNTRTYTLRLEPHYDPGIQTVQMMTS